MKRFLPKSEFGRNVLTLMTGTTIAQAIPIAISPILTRIYTPEDFGVFAFYMAIASIISVVATGRYEMAIMLPEKDDDALNITVLSLLISLLISLLSLIIITIFNDQITNLLNNNKISAWLYFIPASVLMSGIYQSLNYWSNRKSHYKYLSASRILQSSTAAIANIGLGFKNSGSDGLIIGNFVGQFFSVLLLSTTAFSKKKYTLKNITILNIITMAKKYIKFPKYDLLSGLFNTSSSQVPILIMGIFFNNTIIGFYSLAHRILTMPMSLIGSAIGQVFFQESSKNIKNKKILRQLTKNTFTKLFILGFFPMLIMGVFGDYLFIIVFGQNWSAAGTYAQVLSIWIFFVFVTSPLSTLLTSLEKQRESLIFNTLILISRVVALVVGYYIFNNALETIILYTIVSAIFWIGLMLYIFRLINLPIKEIYWLFFLAKILIIITFAIKYMMVI